MLLAFGGLTFLEAPRLQANLPTPWIGLWERINISVFLLWVVVLAPVLWRTGTAQGEIAVRRCVMKPSLFAALAAGVAIPAFGLSTSVTGGI